LIRFGSSILVFFYPYVLKRPRYGQVCQQSREQASLIYPIIAYPSDNDEATVRDRNKPAVYVLSKLEKTLAHFYIPRSRICSEKIECEERSCSTQFLLNESAPTFLLTGLISSTTSSRSALVNSPQEPESRHRKRVFPYWFLVYRRTKLPNTESKGLNSWP
jgi:hypothetical protein